MSVDAESTADSLPAAAFPWAAAEPMRRLTCLIGSSAPAKRATPKNLAKTSEPKTFRLKDLGQSHHNLLDLEDGATLCFASANGANSLDCAASCSARAMFKRRAPADASAVVAHADGIVALRAKWGALPRCQALTGASDRGKAIPIGTVIKLDALTESPGDLATVNARTHQHARVLRLTKDLHGILRERLARTKTLAEDDLCDVLG